MMSKAWIFLLVVAGYLLAQSVGEFAGVDRAFYRTGGPVVILAGRDCLLFAARGRDAGVELLQKITLGGHAMAYAVEDTSKELRFYTTQAAAATACPVVVTK